MNYKLQIISDKNHYFDLDYKNITISMLNSFSDLEAFDYTIIDLNSKKLWNYDEYNHEFKEDPDIRTLTESIKNENKIIVVLPSNKEYTINMVREKKQLKNDTNIISRFLIEYFNITKITLTYGKNKTKINEKNINSDFYFQETSNFNIRTKTETNKPTTIQRRNIVLTTLQLSHGEDIQNFINLIFCKDKYNIPDWFDEIEIFDDKEQKLSIKNKEQEIQSLKEEIAIAENKLEDNNFYKSILYKQSTPLVKVVFKMLEEMLTSDLSDFKDEYNEDFLITKNDITFIGEIKGVNSNLKNGHLAQLNLHYENRKDELKEKNIEENLKPIIIINRFKKYSPKKRKPIDQEQINLAINKYHGTLIITVESLLELYEKFKNNEIRPDKIINRFKDEKGLFKP